MRFRGFTRASVSPEWHLVKAQQKRVFSNGFSGHAAFLRRQPPNR
jgi:hypothetical protein